MRRKIDSVMMGFLRYPESGIVHIGLDEKGNKWLNLSGAPWVYNWAPIRKIVANGAHIQIYCDGKIQSIPIADDSDRFWYPILVNHKSTYLMKSKNRKFDVVDNDDKGYVASADTMKEAWDTAVWWLKFWDDRRTVDIVDNINKTTCTLRLNK